MVLPSGHTNAVLARQFGMTERTIKAHISQILCKVGVEGRVRAAVVAYTWQNCCQHGHVLRSNGAAMD